MGTFMSAPVRQHGPSILHLTTKNDNVVGNEFTGETHNKQCFKRLKTQNVT